MLSSFQGFLRICTLAPESCNLSKAKRETVFLQSGTSLFQRNHLPTAAKNYCSLVYVILFTWSCNRRESIEYVKLYLSLVLHDDITKTVW